MLFKCSGMYSSDRKYDSFSPSGPQWEGLGNKFPKFFSQISLPIVNGCWLSLATPHNTSTSDFSSENQAIVSFICDKVPQVPEFLYSFLMLSLLEEPWNHVFQVNQDAAMIMSNWEPRTFALGCSLQVLTCSGIIHPATDDMKFQWLCFHL